MIHDYVFVRRVALHRFRLGKDTLAVRRQLRDSHGTCLVLRLGAEEYVVPEEINGNPVQGLTDDVVIGHEVESATHFAKKEFEFNHGVRGLAG